MAVGFPSRSECGFLTHPRRSKEAVEEFLGDVRPQVWVADRYGAQAGWATKISKPASPISCAIRNTSSTRATASSPPPYATSSAWLATRRRGATHGTTPRSKSTKGASKPISIASWPDLALPPESEWKSTIEKLRPNLLVFMSNRAVPPTNNESERSPRPCATYRKITNGFRSQWGARQYADIRSVIETARRQSIGALTAIRYVLAAPVGLAVPKTG